MTLDAVVYESVEGFDVSRESFEALKHYHTLLLKWQKAINLVSPSSLSQAWARHFVDSVQVLPHVPQRDAVVADLGSGGGFAGLVVAICRPDLTVHLVDSDMRKCQFLKTVSRESSLANVTVHNGRVESVLPDLRSDYITARGFTALHDIVELSSLCPNFADLSYVLLKGERYAEELEVLRQSYSVDCDVVPSITHHGAAILKLKNVGKL